MLNTTVTHKTSLPSPFSPGPVAVDFPRDGSSTQSAECFRQMAELSIIQSRIHPLVVLDRKSERSDSEVINTLTETYYELMAWKDALPEHLQPQYEISMEVLEMPVASLHFKYYSSVAMIHMAVASLMESATHSTAENLSVTASHTYPSGKEAKAMCATAARSMIRMLRHLPVTPFSLLWYELFDVLFSMKLLLIIEKGR